MYDRDDRLKMENKKMKTYKGEKYIYLLMGYKLAQMNNNNHISIGEDNGMKGGNQFERHFSIQNYKGKILLTETKTSSGFADFSRTFEVVHNNNPITIRDYMNEDSENCGQRWTH